MSRSLIAVICTVCNCHRPLADVLRPDLATTPWSDDGLNLRMAYPADLVKADPAEVMHDGNLVLFGISGNTDSQLAASTHCLRPNLVLQLAPSAQPTTATILLAELDIDCLTSEEQVNSKNLLPTMAEAVNKVPGMKPITQPTWYNIGWQKVHMAAAQGQPQTRQGTGSPGTIKSNEHFAATLHDGHLHDLEQPSPRLVLLLQQHRYAEPNHEDDRTVRTRRCRSSLPGHDGQRHTFRRSKGPFHWYDLFRFWPAELNRFTYIRKTL